MSNLSLMQTFMNAYEYSHKMPVTCHDIHEFIYDCIERAAGHDKSDVPDGFFRVMGDFREYLTKRDVFLSSISRLSNPGEMDRLVLKFTSGETGEEYRLQFILSFQSTIQASGFILKTPNDSIEFTKNITMSHEFSSMVVFPSIENSAVLETFNLNQSDISRLNNFESGVEIKCIDFIERYGVGAEADLLRQLGALSEKPDNHVIMANRTGDPLQAWRAYNEGGPSLEVARDTIKSILLDGSPATDKESFETLSHIINQLEESGETLISFAPLTHADYIPPSARLVRLPEIVDAYLKGASSEQINSLLDVLSQKVFSEVSFSEDVTSAIKKAQLNAIQSDTAPARRAKPKL